MFIPRLLPGETLYSLCARAASFSALDAKLAGFELLGDIRAYRRHDIPIGLSVLEQNCAAAWGIAVHFDQRTLRERTALGLVFPFLDVNHQQRLLSGLRGDEFSLSLRRKSGINRGRETVGLPLRRCPDCASNDIAQYGFAYWHAMHQHPGVIVCPLHSRPLQWLSGRPAKGGGWEVAHRWEGDFHEICVEARHLEALSLVAGAIFWCASHSRLSRNALSMMLRGRFKSLGLMRRETVLEAHEAAFIHNKIAGPLCAARFPYFLRFDDSGWISKVLSDEDFAHPLRWAVLIASTLPQGWQLASTGNGDKQSSLNPREAIEVPTDLDLNLVAAQERAPQLGLFTAGRYARLRLAPESVYQALALGVRLAKAAEMTGHDLDELRRWLKRDPHLVKHWHNSIARLRIQAAERALTDFVRDHPHAMRSAVIHANLRPVRLLERYAPEQLDSVLPAVQSKYSAQRRLWVD